MRGINGREVWLDKDFLGYSSSSEDREVGDDNDNTVDVIMPRIKYLS